MFHFETGQTCWYGQLQQKMAQQFFDPKLYMYVSPCSHGDGLT